MTEAAVPVFDGHNDILLRLQRAPQDRETIWLTGEGKGHLDLPRMKKGGFAGGMFAIYIPSPPEPNAPNYDALMDNPPYDLALPAMIGAEDALPVAFSMASHLLWMARSSKGAFRVCHTAAEIEAARKAGAIAGVMHMEGCEAIDAELDALHAFHAMGLRSLGPVWSRPTIFGHGVPFRFPGNPDTGPGLTDAGKRLIKECNSLRVLVDLSHINEAGFNDVARLSDAPLVATHSNAQAVCRSTRNLTDRQLAEIKESGGMVGLNFATCFLREDGGNRRIWDGSRCCGTGSSDRASGRGSCGLWVGLRRSDGAAGDHRRGRTACVSDRVRAHGYDNALMHKLAWGNWLGVLRRTWGA